MKKIVALLIAVLLIVGGVVLVGKKKEELAAEATPALKYVTVKTATPENAAVEQSRLYIGRYYSLRHPQISSKVSGFIERIAVVEGERVSKGDLLIGIDDRELRAAVKAQRASERAIEISIESLEGSKESVESDYLYAKKVYERNLALFEADALAREKLDFSRVAMELKRSKLDTLVKSIEAKKEELKAAGAQLASKLNLLRYAQIRAPFDGEVGTIHLKEGDLASPGRPILTLLGVKKAVEFNFAPGEGLGIASGMEVWIEGRKAKISKILPQSQKGLKVARIELETPLDLAENQNVAIRVVTKRAEGSAVPVEALLHRADGVYLFEYKDGSFSPKKVRIEATDGRYAVVEPAPAGRVAVGSNDKLSRLFVVKNVKAAEDE